MSLMSASLTRKLSWQILLCPLPTLRSHAAFPAALPFPGPSVRKPEKRPPLFEICGNHPCRLAVPQQAKTKPQEGSDLRYFQGTEPSFLFAGMKSAGKNYPCERIFIGRDEISGEESSLREILICRDEISEGKSSLRENFYLQG